MVGDLNKRFLSLRDIDSLKLYLRLNFPTIAQLLKGTLDFLRCIKNFLLFFATQIKVRKILVDHRELSLDIGGGDSHGRCGLLTIDMTSRCDIFWDLRNGLPFPDNTVKMIYSSNLLEHLSFTEIMSLLSDCKRVMISGGGNISMRP
jgi:hypothetical protein